MTKIFSKPKSFKKNRSSIFTSGICNTFYDSPKRVLFFELDYPIDQKTINRVIEVYRILHLDLVTHSTGNGVHFLSPTMMDLIIWKSAMNLLHDLNKKCPMTTLRFIPNKYPDEVVLWNGSIRTIYNKSLNNSKQMTIFLNDILFTNFKPNLDLSFAIKQVRYPLPLSEYCQ